MLRKKIIVLTCGIALAVSIVFGGFTYGRVHQVTYDTANEGLAGEARLLAMRLKNSFDEMRADAWVASRSPAVEKFAQARIAPLADSEASLAAALFWREQIQDYFTLRMRQRPFYTQMRFIGVDGGGRELVRVNRRDSRLEPVAEPDLQQKSDEPYFKRGLQLGPDETLFSAVTYNREYGKVAPELVPTVRVVAPVFRNGQIVGMIVINASYEFLLTSVYANLPLKRNTFIVTGNGDYMEFRREGGDPVLEFHDNYSAPPPALITKTLASQNNEEVIVDNKFVSYSVRTRLDEATPDLTFSTVLHVPKDELFRGAYQTRRTVLILMALLTACATALSAWLTLIFIKPLTTMTEEIKSRGDNMEVEPRLPTERGDEIGELARAFKSLIDNIRERETYVRTILDGAVDGIITVNQAGVIESSNPACEQMFGYQRNEMVGMKLGMLIPQEYRASHGGRMDEYFSSGKAKTMALGREITGIAKNGSAVPLEVGLNRLVLADQSLHVVAVIRDIKERKQAQREREILIEKLMRSNEELDNFAYIASHDLKEPLRGMYNHASFLLRDCEAKLGESDVKRINRMTDLAKRMEKLINDLLYFSRLGRDTLSYRNVDFNSVVDDIRHMMEDVLIEENGRIDVDLRLPTVYCDEVRVTELLRNLITNGIKYNENEAKLILVGYSERRRAFFVRDNGIGIAEEFHKDVFRIFKRLHSEKKYGPGTGSGLTFVKKIVEQHGGKVWLESSVGQGTKVWFTLAQEE